MSDRSCVEQLSPLDLPMPGTYIRVLLVFRTRDLGQRVYQDLQCGLNKLSTQIPWLSGRVFPTTTSQGRASLEIRSNPGNAPTLVNKGSVAATYKSLATRGMPIEEVPSDLWPAPSLIDDALFAAGAPVFAASLFHFADQGVGLCICIHHNAVDATGFSEVVRLWARNVAESESILSGLSHGRLRRLSEALSPDLQEVSSLSYNTLSALHPEYSNIPPALPDEFPACISKLFKIPVLWINVLKELVSKYTSSAPTANTLVCALIWTTITRVRMQCNSALENELSRLVTAVNGRRRIGEEFSSPANPYFGNAVLYSLTRLPARVLARSDEASVHTLAKICDSISQSQSSSTINSRYIAEVYHLVDCLEDYRSLFVGWDLFKSRDLTITSWADLDLYEMDFGAILGRPQFIRLPYMEADGVAIVLPRRRGVPEEALEIMVMLRRDDMSLLEKDNMWQTLVSIDK